MIAALCMNPCLDKLVTIDTFRYGGMNRIQSARIDASGKGVNIAIAARRLGYESVLLGLMPGQQNERVLARLEAESVRCELTPQTGAVRTNLKVLDTSNGVVTEINEKGVPVEEDELEAVERSIRAWAQRCEWMVFTGSLPPNCPEGTYARFLRAAKAAGRCRCVLDAEGSELTLGLREQPELIKPNRYELELYAGRALPEIQDVADVARGLEAKTRGVVAVSLGGDGALITHGGETYYAPRVPVDVRSTVGAGDCMVMVLLHGLSLGLTLGDAFVWGVAAGTAGVMSEGTELIRLEAVERLRASVRIERL